jgi:ketosteroid isomerase-like protein
MEASSSSARILNRVYGFNLAAVGDRRHGLEEMSEVVAEDFEWTMSPELGSRRVHGLASLADFGQALEQDFESFEYLPEQMTDLADGRVLVTGALRGVGRASRMPLHGEFGHIWTLVDGRAVRVEAYLHAEDARQAANSGH